MKNTILAIAIITTIVVVTGLAVADVQPGAVMAVNKDGLDQFYPTTDVYIKGVNLVPDSPFTWDIYDMDVTCPPGIIDPGIGCSILLHSGTGGSTSNDGSINPLQNAGWLIPNGDYSGHHYKLVATIHPTGETGHGNSAYADYYTKVDSFSPTPEAATIVLTSAGILGIFLVSRKYKKN